MTSTDELVSALTPLYAVSLRRVRMEVTPSRPLRFQDPIHSIARGLMAQSLRRARCLTNANSCRGCDLTQRCDYAQLVGTPDNQKTAPTQWWLQDLPPGVYGGDPPMYTLPEASPFVASLVWVTTALPRPSHLQSALIDALESLGASRQTNPVCVLDDEPLDWSLPPAPVGSIRVTAVTPLALFDGRPDHDQQRLERSCEKCPGAPWLAQIAAMGLHRLSRLSVRYGQTVISRVHLPDMREVERTDGDLTRTTVWRYSHEQNRRMPIDVLVGASTLRGPGAFALLPILHALSLTSVGKHTALGFGHLRCSSLP